MLKSPQMLGLEACYAHFSEIFVDSFVDNFRQYLIVLMGRGLATFLIVDTSYTHIHKNRHTMLCMQGKAVSAMCQN